MSPLRIRHSTCRFIYEKKDRTSSSLIARGSAPFSRFISFLAYSNQTDIKNGQQRGAVAVDIHYNNQNRPLKRRFCFLLTLISKNVEEENDDDKMVYYACQVCGITIFSAGAIAEAWKSAPPQCCNEFMVEQQEEEL